MRESWRNSGSAPYGEVVFRYCPGKMRVVKWNQNGYRDVLTGEIYNRQGQGSNGAFWATVPKDAHFIIQDLLK